MSDDELIVKDCNGARLHEGDTVHVIKDLKVKGYIIGDQARH